MELDLSTQFQMYLGTAERELSPWLRLARDAKTAVDIGAGFGEQTLYLLLKTRAHVLSFEPADRERAAMRRNILLNQVNTSRLEVIPRLAGDEVPLDSLLRYKPPFFFKIDVDGPEARILRTGERLMREAETRWIVETHSKELEDECISILRGAGLKTHVIKNAWWRIFLPEQRPLEHNRWLVAATWL